MPSAAIALDLRFESPDGDAARTCVAAYFGELNARFDDGFDPGGGSDPAAADMTAPNGAFLVARLGGEAVGCGGLKTLETGIGEVKRVWTSPNARGQGVARAIMAALETKARAMGLNALRLDTNRALVEAQAFYRGLGYRPIASYNDNAFADFWFEKAL